MKHSPYEKSVLERMARGALCAEGFLGADQRELADIISADSATVESAALTHEKIAAKLHELMKQAIKQLGRTVRINENLTVVWREGMGRIPSPWPGEGVFPKGEMEIHDERIGKTYYVTPLSVHLIAAHGFYQGRGCRYRLSPRDLIKTLDLA